MLYKFLKWVAQISLKIFFKKIHKASLAKIPTNSPLIVVSNHPNTFMDALLIATLINREFYFLTNASVFTRPWMHWILRKLHMIPIYRKQDVQNGNPDNTQSFEICIKHLKNNGALIIFPEGVSESKRQLKKFKTGTARIALLAEKSSNFNLNLVILPVGINYSQPENFRSEVLVITGHPILVKNYQDFYENDPQNAVLRLTEDIFLGVQELVIDTTSDTEDTLLKNIRTILTNEYEMDNKIYGIFSIEKEVQTAIQYFSTEKPYEWHEFVQNLKAYFYAIDQLQVDDKTVSNAKSLKKLYQISLIKFIVLVVLSPIFALGWFTNWVPYSLPRMVALNVTPYKEYHAGIKLLTGLIAFPLWYFLSYLWIVYLFQKKIVSLFIWLLFPLLGFFALNFASQWAKVQKNLKLVFEFQKNKRKITELRRLRKKIVQELKDFQEEYQNYLSKKNETSK